ncbi:MAG: ABC transporter ATP-binding protein [Chitinophagaceae bacterium]
MKKQTFNLGHFKKDLGRALRLVFSASPRTAGLNLFVLLIQAFLPVASLHFLRLLVEIVVQEPKADFSQVVPVIIGFSIVQLLIALAGQYATYITTVYQQKLTDYMSELVLNKAIEVDMEYYENPAYHDTLHLAQQQSLHRVTQLLANFNALLLSSFSLVFLTGLFLTMHWVYALLFMGLSLPLAAVKWYYAHRLYGLEKKFVTMERESNYLHQVLTGISSAKEVRTLGYGPSFIRKFRSIRAVIFKGKKDLNARLTFFSLLAEALEVVVVAVIFFMMARSTWEGAMTAGVFVVYLQGFQRLQGAAKTFLQSVVQLFQQRLFLRDLFSFIDIPFSRASSPGLAFPQPKEGLTIQDLSFSYPGTSVQVLDQINIRCRPGSMIAIVGENGSGKSTLVKLLARLYRIQQGAIRIDDTAIDDIATPAFREQTVFLFQDFEKYLLTVEENIALGSAKEKTSEAIEQAGRLSGAHSFITRLAHGYQTRLGRTFKHSIQLSGGQWQKLALARAFYNSAQLVVLDEPTSAIDAIAEYDLFRHLKELSKEKMIVLISHRLYNIKLADYIYVMHEGRIAEEGNFATLTGRDGLFKKMYDRQKLD